MPQVYPQKQHFLFVPLFPATLCKIIKDNLMIYVNVAPTLAAAAACIDIEDGPNAANEAAAAAAAAVEGEVVPPKITPEHPKGDDKEVDE